MNQIETKEYIERIKEKIDKEIAEMSTIARYLDSHKLKIERDFMFERIQILENFHTILRNIDLYDKLERDHADRVFENHKFVRLTN